jgi:hypothetical protein
MVRGQLSWRSTLRTLSSGRESEKECVLLRLVTLASEGAADAECLAVEERLGL